MKKIIFGVSAIALLFSLGECANRIDPGYVGIKVNYYGSDKGVSDLPLLTGMVWYNPLTSTVYEFPTFVQTTKWTAEKGEEVTYTSREGLVFSSDISLSYQIKATKVPDFYVQFRSDNIDTFTHGFLRNVTKDAFNEIASQYATDELYSTKKDELLIKVREYVNKQVENIGVSLIQLGYVGAPRPPEQVTAKINKKIEANQEAEAAQNRVAQVEAEARQRIAQAIGEADANARLAKSLTPDMIEWKRLDILKAAVEKWDGTRPQVEGLNSGGLLFNLHTTPQTK